MTPKHAQSTKAEDDNKFVSGSILLFFMRQEPAQHAEDNAIHYTHKDLNRTFKYCPDQWTCGKKFWLWEV